MKKTREQREKIDRIAKHLHPHDDPPDPTADRDWETNTNKTVI